ncbi:MAG: sulfatase-like hydrolase/transferase, partial [Planctomycetes bacterium]|nr:sulfatase-like hydrolase/transferase [Planctomycetota bacterium]
MGTRPNILFLLSDEHSFRFMGHTPVEAGGEADVETPTIDKLASQGTVFTDAYCQMPLCTPSRISFLCGKEVRKSGAWCNESELRPTLDTIPGTLAKGGYSTCLVGKMHLGGNLQYCGFQYRPYGDLSGKCGHQWEPLGGEHGGMRGRTSVCVGVTEIPQSQLQEEIVATESLSWLREQRHRNPDQPWFLCASFSRPHFPLTAPQRWIDRYSPDKISRPKVGKSGDAWNHPMSEGMREGFKADEIGDEEMMRARAAYFACVSYLDEILGDMIARLDAAGFLDNTIIVYSSDHGELAGEHGVWWKNGWYEGCTRVPFIVSTPEQRRGERPAKRLETPVALLDLFPTMCGFGDVECPSGLDG